ncbi:MAG: DegT/DnrJ/EryC1/StrS family aminotransferase [Candidatus Coatesbacteria bacterium]|nr:DegT/DnrJ/EryC1/StrS family aminotransferase [Candidatus Coatesbacteria bacterium]
MIKFLSLKDQYNSIRVEIEEAIRNVINDCAFSGGKYVEKFEHEFSSYLSENGEYVCCSSGTSALHLTLIAIGIGKDDEVIMPSHTFFATVEAIAYTGAKPVLIDCCEDYLIDTSMIESKINPKTKAIIPVHLYGQPANMDEIMHIAERRNLIVIEDSCQAHGAIYRGKKAGTIGHAGCFSFYPGKNLGAYGEGGGIFTKDPDIARKIRMLRSHGEKARYQHQFIGYNERMDGIQGAVLSVKLRYLDEWNKKRNEIADLYRKYLCNDRIKLPEKHDDRTHVYHLFVIQIDGRNELMNTLKRNDIDCAIHYPKAIHQHEAMKHYDFFMKDNDYPVSSRLVDRILSLPIYAEMKISDVEQVSEQILKAIQ